MRFGLLITHVNCVTVFITTTIFIDTNNRVEGSNYLASSGNKVSTNITTSNEKIITQIPNSMIRHFTPSIKSSSAKSLNLNEGHFVLGNEFPNLDIHNGVDISDDYDETIEKNINNKNDDSYNNTFSSNNKFKDINVLSSLTNLTFLGKTSQIRLALRKPLDNQTYLSLDNILGKQRFIFANTTVNDNKTEVTSLIGNWITTDEILQNNTEITEHFVTTTDLIVITMSENNVRTTDHNFKVVNSDVITMLPSVISENEKNFEFEYDFDKTMGIDNTSWDLDNFQKPESLDYISGVDIDSSFSSTGILNLGEVAITEFPSSSNFYVPSSSNSKELEYGLSFGFNDEVWHSKSSSTVIEIGARTSSVLDSAKTLSKSLAGISESFRKSILGISDKISDNPNSHHYSTIQTTKSSLPILHTSKKSKTTTYKSTTRESEKDSTKKSHPKSSLTPNIHPILDLHKPKPTIIPHNHSYLSNGILLSTSPMVLFLVLVLM